MQNKLNVNSTYKYCVSAGRSDGISFKDLELQSVTKPALTSWTLTQSFASTNFQVRQRRRKIDVCGGLGTTIILTTEKR